MICMELHAKNIGKVRIVSSEAGLEISCKAKHIMSFMLEFTTTARKYLQVRKDFHVKVEGEDCFLQTKWQSFDSAYAEAMRLVKDIPQLDNLTDQMLLRFQDQPAIRFLQEGGAKNEKEVYQC